MTVGVAGLVQSGGFGSFSKAYGLAAASLLEAEVVTADGEVRIANACSDPDLFWALKGGGGGSLGVVTRADLARASAAGGLRRGEHDDQGRVAGGVPPARRPDRRLLRRAPGRTRTGASRSASGRDNVLQGLDGVPGPRRAARRRRCGSRSWTRSTPAEGMEGRVLAAEDRLDVGARRSGRRRSSSACSASSAATTGPARRETNVFWPGDQGQAGQFLHGYELDLAAGVAAAARAPRRAGRCALRREPALGRRRCTSTRASPARRPTRWPRRATRR